MWQENYITGTSGTRVLEVWDLPRWASAKKLGLLTAHGHRDLPLLLCPGAVTGGLGRFEGMRHARRL